MFENDPGVRNFCQWNFFKYFFISRTLFRAKNIFCIFPTFQRALKAKKIFLLSRPFDKLKKCKVYSLLGKNDSCVSLCTTVVVLSYQLKLFDKTLFLTVILYVIIVFSFRFHVRNRDLYGSKFN